MEDGMDVMNPPGTVYLTPRQLAERQPAFNLNQLRWLLVHRNVNGMNRCIRRIGKRLLVDEKAFLEWIDAHHERR
jgi:hypothetical protein